MIKSCSGGPSYFDNLKSSAEMVDNQTSVDESIKKDQTWLYDTIKNQFGLEKANYNLQCIEMDTNRGGYIKAKGAYKDGSKLELYYHWGWCAPSGYDCGWIICFSSSDDNLFESVKSDYCNKISSHQSHGGPICTLEAYDNTQEVRDKCNAGEFEKITEGKKTLSIIQDSNSCKTSVTTGKFNCLELTGS